MIGQINELFENQLQVWQLAAKNYLSLQEVRIREFQFEDFSVFAQFNPARMQSSSAKIDSKSIQDRKCFLCPDNLPVEQKGIPYGIDYQILVNPFPIFPQHFTVPLVRHADQLIDDKYGEMIDLAELLEEYVIFYNGPKCGASAPDHAHFQVGSKNFIPLQKDIHNITKEIILTTNNLVIYALRKYLRNAFLIESVTKEGILRAFSHLYSLMEQKVEDKEPMMNIFTWYDKNKWFSCIFPREKHRPDCFYAGGKDNILISPGSVDMGGILILPQEEDFTKITEQDIKNIFREVSISDLKMEGIIEKLKAT
ncbi:MAG: DUF4922 domain-containing protein [Dysgonomonas sp.]|nr:DUF4922 domain-containing protein [Dysgonomonas sp.]